MVSFGGGSLPLQVCDDCDPVGYSSESNRSVKLRSLTFKGLVKQDTNGAEGTGKGGDVISDDGSDMTSSGDESEDGVNQGDNMIHHTNYERDERDDDYASNDSYSTAGESGTFATSSSYSSNSYSFQPNDQWLHKPNTNNSNVDGWIAIVHAKLAATKLARRMKRKLAVDMAKRANDIDLAKALPEAVDGCVSPHMNMIALLSYGGGGKGGSGYHLQVKK